MKILFTGGGSGGHFYPIIAVAEAVNTEVRERKLLEPQLYYAAPDPYDREMLVAQNITFVATSAGNMRGSNSLLNFVGYIKTAWGVTKSIIRIFFLYPDVVFGTGGYASFPSLLAAKLFKIPVVIYATDADPSRVNKWAGKFAAKIAISYPESAEYFPKDKVAFTGNPVRKSLLIPAREGAYEFLKMRHDLPVILVIGGSQGAQAINEAILAALPQLVGKYQIVHQTGEANFTDVTGRAKVVLAENVNAANYKPFDYLNDLAMRMSAGVASLVISRAGSGSIFEIATWGLPSILIPIPEPISHDQGKNAFAYARTGACVVIEQNNLTSGLLLSEIGRILDNEEQKHKMSSAARSFARPDAAKAIADALLDIGLSHEQ
jgi:UDP-N-acetylglucosamine--N-acetylmuramyl-(pentapeptide) pyrophosphoryl-undecaprenol N-acetylglucosamine transferase